MIAISRVLSFFLAIVLSGCISINLPSVQPLAEKVVAGEGKAKILLVDISGIIKDEENANVLGLQGSPNLTARVREELDLASKDDAVKAVVLRINTPGGSVTTSDIISHEIESFKKKRKVPVVAELMDVAASGGYYIASSADRIIAHPTTVTGSIGVIAISVSASGLMEKIGITNQTIKSGPLKDIGSPLKTMTEEERRILQSVIDGMYDRFIDRVMTGRPDSFTLDELRKIADGRVYTASQAKDLKLIDSIGYLDDAIDWAKQASGVKEARVVTYAQPRAYRNNIYSRAESAPSGINLINIDAGIPKASGMEFMYIWLP